MGPVLSFAIMWLLMPVHNTVRYLTQKRITEKDKKTKTTKN